MTAQAAVVAQRQLDTDVAAADEDRPPRRRIQAEGRQRRALRRKQKEKAALGQVVPPDASRWTPWLVLLARVFGADLARCPGCGASCWAVDLVLGAGRSKRELLLLGVRRAPSEVDFVNAAL